MTVIALSMALKGIILFSVGVYRDSAKQRANSHDGR